MKKTAEPAVILENLTGLFCYSLELVKGVMYGLTPLC